MTEIIETSKQEEQSVKKEEKNIKGGIKKRKFFKKRYLINLRSYIKLLTKKYKIKLRGGAYEIINDIVNYLLEAILKNSSTLCKASKRSTISIKDIYGSIMLLFGQGQLYSLCYFSSSEAITNYNKSMNE